MKSNIQLTGNLDWKQFKVSDLFDVINGVGVTKNEILNNPGNIRAIQSGEEDMGCIGTISEDYCKKKNYYIADKPCLTVARSGSSGFIGVQEFPCIVGDSAKLLIPKIQLDIEELLYIRAALMVVKQKYCYDDKVSEKRYKEEKIILPVSKGELAHDYIKEQMKQYLTKSKNIVEKYIP